jgi:Ca2+-binding EF-hand superfamily protein
MTTKFEKEIISEINAFRDDPSSIEHQIEVLRKAVSRLRSKDPFLTEIDNFISELPRIPRMKTVTYNKVLSQYCKKELKKFTKDPDNYNRYLIGSEIKGIVPDCYIKENASLIADDGADEANTVVSKILLNKIDKYKKGRDILTTDNYTQIGIATTEYDGENYYIIIFARNNVKDDSEPKLPNVDLTELKQAFDLYDHDHTEKIKIQEAIDGMRSVKFDRTNPELYGIIEELKEYEWCSWPRFAYHIHSRITDRSSDEGLKTLFNLFIDDPKRNTINFETFKRICGEIGENLSEEEMKNILEVTTETGKDISFEDFCQYMRLTN